MLVLGHPEGDLDVHGEAVGGLQVSPPCSALLAAFLPSPFSSLPFSLPLLSALLGVVLVVVALAPRHMSIEKLDSSHYLQPNMLPQC